MQLNYFVQEGDFLTEVKDQMVPLVMCAIGIYYKMRAEMKPTPSKTHYTFNLRDLSKVRFLSTIEVEHSTEKLQRLLHLQVIHGLFQADERVILTREHCSTLLAHEATRVFHDRLVEEADRAHFFEILSDDIMSCFKTRYPAKELRENAVMYGDFLKLTSGSTERVYRPISDRRQLANIIEELYMKHTADKKSVILELNCALHFLFFIEIYTSLCSPRTSSSSKKLWNTSCALQESSDSQEDICCWWGSVLRISICAPLQIFCFLHFRLVWTELESLQRLQWLA